MKRLIAAAALTGVVAVLAGCERKEPQAPVSATITAETATSTGSTPARTGAESPAPPPAPVSAPEVGPGAPMFAAIYPGGQVEVAPTTATGPAGPGGILTYTTPADPDAVIAFHKGRAEAEGLSSVMAMNQGDARAYSAAKTGTGANLQVVASPTEGGETSVQLSWSAGR